MPRRQKPAEPQRSCAGCRQVRDQRILLRLTRSSEGTIRLDEGKRLPGRGAYLCRNRSCLLEARRRRRLERSLRIRTLTEADWAAIEAGIIKAR